MIIGIDVGSTTGYAIWDEDQNILVESGNILSEDIENSILSKQYVGATVIVEYPVNTPTCPRSAKSAARKIQVLFPQAIEVVPGQWKNSGIQLRSPFPWKRYPDPTPHQRDAYWILRFGMELAKAKV